MNDFDKEVKYVTKCKHVETGNVLYTAGRVVGVLVRPEGEYKPVETREVVKQNQVDAVFGAFDDE